MSARLRCVPWASIGATLLLLAEAACGGPKAPWTEAPPVALDLVASQSAASVPLLGDVAIVLDLFHRADLEVDFDPQVPTGCTGTIELRPECPLGSGRWRQAVLRLRPITGPGVLTIAPFQAKAHDGTVTASTAELHLDVTSLLAATPGELEAPAPPMVPPWSRWWYAGIAAAVLLAGAAWYIATHRRARLPPPLPIEIAVPAHVKAMRELARLRRLSRRTPAELDVFYVATSQVLRVYLEDRFGLRAPDRTTEEFLLEVEAGGPLSVAQCLEVRRFLQQCDLVKFAAQLPPEATHLQTLAIAEALIEATRADRVPMEASA